MIDDSVVTVIIVAWSSRGEIAQCLESLRGLGHLPLKLETIVVDNASKDGTAEFLQTSLSRFKNIGLKVLLNERNVGLARATEQAFKESLGRRILLCNPDIIFDDSLGEMFLHSLSHPNEILAAMMVNSDGSYQKVIYRRFPNVTRVFFDNGVIGSFLDAKLTGRLVRRDYCYQREEFSAPTIRLEDPGASLLLLTRDVITKLGGYVFSREFPVYWGDVDLAKRAESAGVERILLTKVTAFHRLGHSVDTLSKPAQTYLFLRGVMNYARKWRMHPLIISFLFSVDAVASVPFLVAFRSKKGSKFPIRKIVLIAAAQMSAVCGR